MKIDEYIKLKDPKDIMEGLLKELRDKVINLKRDAAVKRAMNLIDKKWRSIAKRRMLRENGFSSTIEFYYPEVYKRWKK